MTSHSKSPCSSPVIPTFEPRDVTTAGLLMPWSFRFALTEMIGHKSPWRPYCVPTRAFWAVEPPDTWFWWRTKEFLRWGLREQHRTDHGYCLQCWPQYTSANAQYATIIIIELEDKTGQLLTVWTEWFSCRPFLGAVRFGSGAMLLSSVSSSHMFSVTFCP
jgi:hypothetical protein